MKFSHQKKKAANLKIGDSSPCTWGRGSCEVYGRGTQKANSKMGDSSPLNWADKYCAIIHSAIARPGGNVAMVPLSSRRVSVRGCMWV